MYTHTHTYRTLCEVTTVRSQHCSLRRAARCVCVYVCVYVSMSLCVC